MYVIKISINVLKKKLKRIKICLGCYSRSSSTTPPEGEPTDPRDPNKKEKQKTPSKRRRQTIPVAPRSGQDTSTDLAGDTPPPPTPRPTKQNKCKPRPGSRLDCPGERQNNGSISSRPYYGGVQTRRPDHVTTPEAPGRRAPGAGGTKEKGRGTAFRWKTPSEGVEMRFLLVRTSPAEDHP
ncbi:hypothetical protein GWI33_004278 [Rhynchophorus ferrugineus]|uniref:Uncharacterized protein n=1 Tax=Rhynchophorus ferrugineus TaxID=354439 RepID=A0A834IMJ3_RHYFE|nr:hypothetical protein GWI33_004278 [Rhynchophorus ferrugineus]